MDPSDKLEVDYHATGDYFRELAGTRFKLLAFVPSVTGVTVALADLGCPSVRLGVLGAFGFLVTLGVLFYDVRNTQLYDALNLRAKCLEAYLGLPKASNRYYKRGGAFLDRPRRELKLFRFFEIWHDRGLAIIYSTSLAAWAYILVGGFFGLPGHDCALRGAWLALLTPVAVWLLFILQLSAYDNPTDPKGALPEDVAALLEKPPKQSLEDT